MSANRAAHSPDVRQRASRAATGPMGEVPITQRLTAPRELIDCVRGGQRVTYLKMSDDHAVVVAVEGEMADWAIAVSYTHLTLPTICSV